MYSIDRATRRRKNRLNPCLTSLEDRQLLSIGWGTPDTITINSAPTTVAVQVGHPDTQKLLSATVSGGSQLMAQVDWGDGAVSNIKGTLTAGSTTSWNWWNPSPSSFDINGGHKYQKVGLYTAKCYLWDALYTRQEVDFTVDAYDFAWEEAEPVGAPKDVVGARVTFIAKIVSDNPTDTVVSATWSVTSADGTSPGLLTVPDGLDPVDAHGFNIRKTPSAFTASLAPPAKSMMSDPTLPTYWDASPGDHTISEDAFYMVAGRLVENKTTTYVSIQAPPSAVNAQFSGGVSVKTYVAGENVDPLGTYLSSTPTGYGSGVRIDAAIDPQGGKFAGTFGIVQTVQSATYRWTVDQNGVERKYQFFTNTGGLDASNFPILDSDPSGQDGPYYNMGLTGKTAGSVDTSQVLTLSDTPRSIYDAQLSGLPAGQTVVKLDRFDRFTDTVMYTPTGGIPVPVSVFGWAWGGTLSGPLFGPILPTLSNVLAPQDYNPIAPMTDLPPEGVVDTSVFPKWNSTNQSAMGKFVELTV